MALDPLATAADLTALGVDTTDGVRVASLLASVSAAVRDAAGCTITSVTATVGGLQGSREQWFDIPGWAIRSVDEVLLNGVEVTDYRFIGGKLWRQSGWQPGRAPSEVEITYTQGLDNAPADIVKLVCTLVAAGLHEASEGMGETRGLTSTRVDDYAESYARGEDEVVDLTELPERTKESLAKRFGGGVAVIGTY